MAPPPSSDTPPEMPQSTGDPEEDLLLAAAEGRAQPQPVQHGQRARGVAVAEHAPQRDGRELLKLRNGAAELVIDANRVVDIAYEDRGVLGLTVVVSGRGGAFMLATLLVRTPWSASLW